MGVGARGMFRWAVDGGLVRGVGGHGRGAATPATSPPSGTPHWVPWSGALGSNPSYGHNPPSPFGFSCALLGGLADD